jgi:hypothetical protein
MIPKLFQNDRFWSKVNKKDAAECWEWLGHIGENGYGQFRMAEGAVPAHRMSYELTYGPIRAAHRVVMHSCDNRRCVNPAHLSLGNVRANAWDMIVKDRLPMGPEHWNYKHGKYSQGKR